MPCTSPLSAWQSPSGGRLEFSPRDDSPMLLVPCGRCTWCRLERSRQWALRCQHESSLHERSCFLTLTYREMPAGGSLSKRHLQGFLKRLRRCLSPSRIRFFSCGEYGEKFSRPHYHLLIFGEDFSFDRQAISHQLFLSPTVSKLWPFGFHSIGAFSVEAAAYTARYCLKKVSGPSFSKGLHYRSRVPEFTQMSRRPGIGAGWFDRYKFDVFPSDLNNEGVVDSNGRLGRPPRYYDKLLDREMPAMLADLKARRRLKSQDFALSDESREAFDKNLRARLALFHPRKFEGIQ